MPANGPADASALPKPDDKGFWVGILQAVKTPLGFFTLISLISLSIVTGIMTKVGLSPVVTTILTCATVGLLFLACIAVFTLAILQPEAKHRIVSDQSQAKTGSASDTHVQRIVQAQGHDVLFADESRGAPLDIWYREMRQYLHQAAHYSVPTYYLDNKLHVTDWNLAFEIVFAELAGNLRGKHVNWLIAQLANCDEVFNHAREFTRNVIEKGAFPHADLEHIDFQSQEFGLVRTLKVASQLNDGTGKGVGWAVALIPKEIDWQNFESKLKDRIITDKRWSAYSASYDRVLGLFPPYKQLLQDVTAVVPPGNLSVIDLGAGTGEVTSLLLKKGHRVTAVEDNIGMLDRFVLKSFDRNVTKLIKSSVEHLDFLAAASFDAAVMVNVLYALDHPLECLREVFRILRPNGVLGLSTTHRETNLDPLLKAIEATLRQANEMERLAADWEVVRKVNKNLEGSVVRRHTREQVREMVKLAGFEIITEIPSTYEGAVMVIHARKPAP